MAVTRHPAAETSSATDPPRAMDTKQTNLTHTHVSSDFVGGNAKTPANPTSSTASDTSIANQYGRPA